MRDSFSGPDFRVSREPGAQLAKKCLPRIDGKAK
jgi:hypothetical protein